MSALFLAKDEMRELTGYIRHSMQIAWLRNNRYVFEVNKEGVPKVLRSHLIAKLTEAPALSAVPNFGALKRGKKTA